MNLALLKHKTVIAEAHQSGVEHFLKKEIYFTHIANTLTSSLSQEDSRK